MNRALFLDRDGVINELVFYPSHGEWEGPRNVRDLRMRAGAAASLRDAAKAGCVSLHIYSLPIDSCVAFDLKNQRCFRRTFSYYSQYGKVEIEVEHPADGPVKPVQITA